MLNHGRYIIGDCIGFGGFGIVYIAWDTTLKITVAVKEFYASQLMTRVPKVNKLVINPKSANEFYYRKKRFLAEARTLTKFQHLNSVPHVFEYFEENDTAYLVIEHLKGMDLKEYLAQFNGPIDQNTAIYITLEIAAALQALHSEGIIHRDVAPDNIFICSGTREVQVKLLDVGSAILQDETDNVVDLVMKPGFSPREQYDKSNPRVGPWMDIYALGATLYMMLTGIKPDESTNRKIKDETPAVRELNPSVSEQLSNTVMKAIAVESQMRFKTVQEFVDALKGQRKVYTQKKEKRLRRMRWTGGILAACAALVAVGGYSLHLFSQKRAEGILQPAELSVWYSVEQNSDERAAMESVKADFEKAYPDVTLVLKGVPAEQYQQQLADAAQKNDLPSLFESTGVSNEILEKCNDLTPVRQSKQFENCLFLDQYDQYYDRSLQIPLGIEVPLAYIITNGAAVVDYDKTYFDSLENFGTETNIAADAQRSAMICANFGTGPFADREAFLQPVENTSPVLLSSTMIMNEARQVLVNYEKDYVYYQADKIFCDFVYEWSICTDEEAETAAAERLLSWMLGNVYQTTLMITECNDGQIPVNPLCFDAKIKARNLAPISEIYKNFVFEREGTAQ